MLAWKEHAQCGGCGGGGAAAAQSLTSCPALHNPVDLSPPGSFFPWNSLGKDARVGYPALLQVIFPTQRSNSYLLCPICKESTADGFFTS